MIHDTAQRAVARCLVDPGFIDRTPVPGDAPNVAPDLRERLRLFRGFITRVKHAQLRRALPLTLRLMTLHGCNVEIFSDLAHDYQLARRHGPLSLGGLIDGFLASLSQTMPRLNEVAREQIGAMARHETAIWRAISRPQITDAPPNACLAPGVSVERLDVDVFGLAGALKLQAFSLPASSKSAVCVLYRPEGPGARAEEIDPLSGLILAQLDGETTVAELNGMLAAVAGGDATHAIEAIIEDAAERGLVTRPVSEAV